MAILDARAAWKEARATPDETHIREAFRRCVLAARIVRRVAATLPPGDGQRRMIDEAERIAVTAAGLRTRLARIVVDGQR